MVIVSYVHMFQFSLDSYLCPSKVYISLKGIALYFVATTIGGITNPDIAFCWERQKNMGLTVVLPPILKWPEQNHPHPGKVEVSICVSTDTNVLTGGNSKHYCGKQQSLLTECGVTSEQD